MRAIAVPLLLLGLSSCRRLPPPETSRPPRRSEPPASVERPPVATPDTTSPAVAAIVDSIRRAVRDSIHTDARRDSIAAATRAALEAAERDSIAAAARRDSIAAAARRDSIEAARRDSVAAVRADSIAAAVLDSIAVARAASVASAIADSVAGARATSPVPDSAIAEDVQALRELGPAFIPYDEGPRALWDTETQARLTKTLLPVLRREGLGARTRTIFWVLISATGEVVELVPQTGSGSEAFDEAAAAFARQLVFRPAIRGGHPVAVWVVREISIVMQ